MQFRVKHIRSSALYYAIFLSVIFALILGGFILMSAFNRNFSTRMDIEELLRDNAQSGIVYGQAYYQEFKANDSKTIRLYDNGVDSVEITKKNWGVYTVLQAKAIHNKRENTLLALFGEATDQNQPNFYIPDNGRPISLCGDARLEGECYLPKSGVKRAYINGKSYTGEQLLFGSKKQSEKHLPELRSDFKELYSIRNARIEHFPDDKDTIQTPFSQEAQHYIIDGSLDLSNKVIKGQVVIEARDSIYINASTRIEQAIIKGNIIHIDQDFTGSGQFIANNKIYIAEGSTLLYPSVVGVQEKVFPTEQNVSLTLAANSQVIGTVFLISETPNFRLMPQLNLHKDAEIDGVVYCVGKTALNGIIKGHLYSQKLYLKTAASAYENHLLDGKVLDALPKTFSAANLFDKPTYLTQLQWLK